MKKNLQLLTTVLPISSDELTASFAKAVDKAVSESSRAGLGIPYLRNGKIVWIRK